MPEPVCVIEIKRKWHNFDHRYIARCVVPSLLVVGKLLKQELQVCQRLFELCLGSCIATALPDLQESGKGMRQGEATRVERKRSGEGGLVFGPVTRPC